MHIVGTWTNSECDRHDELVPPLVVEWEGDGREIPDVAWVYAGYDFICAANVRERLKLIGDHFIFEPVIVAFQNSNICEEERLAILGRRYSWPVPRKTISIDASVNALEEKVFCRKCGKKKFSFKISNLLVDGRSLVDVDAFSIRELGVYSPVFVTDAYREILETQVIENIAWIEAGYAA